MWSFLKPPEVVLMGRGLAFGCKAGDDIQDNLIEKSMSCQKTSVNYCWNYLLTS